VPVPRIIHLVDDTTAGGVMRLLNYIMCLPQLAASSLQTMRSVKRNAISHGNIRADVIVSHLSIRWRSLPALVALRAMHPNAWLVHVEHSYTRAFTASNVLKKRRFFTLLRVAYSLFDRVVAVSQDQGGWFLDNKLVEKDNLMVIPNNIDLDLFVKLPRARSKPRVIGAIGRLDRQKSFDILIQAFRLCKERDLRLRIFGEGPEKPALKKLAEGDDRIEFCGHENEPIEIYSKIDVVAMPSRWEAFGLVALEARAAGRPVLVSGVDGLRDHIALGAIPVGRLDPETWAESLLRLCSVDHNQSPISETNRIAMNNRFSESWRTVLGIGSRANPRGRFLSGGSLKRVPNSI
jgi:D-inositol-3-phosphate glycosyltransferase